jgi:hypothetical protein
MSHFLPKFNQKNRLNYSTSSLLSLLVQQQRFDKHVFVVEEMDEDILIIILNDIFDYDMVSQSQVLVELYNQWVKNFRLEIFH